MIKKYNYMTGTKTRSIQNDVCLVEIRILYSNLFIHV